MTPQTDDSCPGTWTHLQWREVCSQMQLSEVLCMCIWQGCCPPWSCQSQLPRNGNLPCTLHTLILHTHSTTMGTAYKRCGMHLESNLSRSIQQTQVLVMHWHQTLIFPCEETSKHTRCCLQKGTWSCSSTGWWPSCLCLQSTYPNRTVLC